MTIIKRVEEITIFESPDGGKTIYSRDMRNPDRQMVYQDPSIHWKARWYEWQDILQAAEKYPALQDAINKAEMVWLLIKEK